MIDNYLGEPEPSSLSLNIQKVVSLLLSQPPIKKSYSYVKGTFDTIMSVKVKGDTFFVIKTVFKSAEKSGAQI